MWRGFVEKLCLCIENSFILRGNKGFANILNVNFVPKKIGSPREHYTSFPLVTLECCCLPGKLQKHKKLRSFFCLQDRRNSHHFFKLGRLACSQNSRMFITFFRSESEITEQARQARKVLYIYVHAIVCSWAELCKNSFKDFLLWRN